MAELLPVAQSWESLAVQLDIRRHTRSGIKYRYKNHQNSPRVELEEVLSRWYEGGSLNQLIEALNVLDEEYLASSLQLKFQKSS